MSQRTAARSEMNLLPGVTNPRGGGVDVVPRGGGAEGGCAGVSEVPAV
jgi:hypothetical protein